MRYSTDVISGDHDVLPISLHDGFAESGLALERVADARGFDAHGCRDVAEVKAAIAYDIPLACGEDRLFRIRLLLTQISFPYHTTDRD